uniref:Uncharacterized protein n=1 Tax=Anguilla anguilla TaxID=7936 RepID=A0A0E9PWU0_ANGAN
MLSLTEQQTAHRTNLLESFHPSNTDFSSVLLRATEKGT